MKKSVVIFIIGILIALGAGFYGGQQYERSRQDVSRSASVEGRFQAFRTGNGMPGQGGDHLNGRQRGNGNGFAAGEIIAKDEKTITLKLQEGGSKIVLLSPSMSIGTFQAGTSSDLTVGTPVVVMGEGNSDGSMTAQSIQVRPPQDMQRVQFRGRGE